MRRVLAIVTLILSLPFLAFGGWWVWSNRGDVLFYAPALGSLAIALAGAAVGWLIMRALFSKRS